MKKTYRRGDYVLSIDHDWCKGCELCVKSCPVGIIRLNEEGKAELLEIERCIFCGICELRCPDFAIRIERPAPAAEGAEPAEERTREEKESLEVR